MPAPSRVDLLDLVAYQIAEPGLRIVSAPRTRDWMADTRQRFANRCLPLLIANQSGWLILNSVPFTVMWTGGEGVESLLISADSPTPAPYVGSHFGHGILTWAVPYLFRTPPGFNLLVRGPANCPKDAVAALEGVVETDWAPVTFTLNWKLTRSFVPVRFDADEPIGMIVPQRRGDLEAFAPEIRPLESNERLRRRYDAWWGSRKRVLRERFRGRADVGKVRWQQHYFVGREVTGEPAGQDHQVRLHIREFRAR